MAGPLRRSPLRLRSGDLRSAAADLGLQWEWGLQLPPVGFRGQAKPQAAGACSPLGLGGRLAASTARHILKNTDLDRVGHLSHGSN